MLTEAISNKSKSDALYQGLRDLIARCGPNATKHEHAIVSISACLLHGINTKSQLIGVLRHIGLKPGHIAQTLKRGTGPSPTAHHWQCIDGVYSEHENEPAEIGWVS